MMTKKSKRNSAIELLRIFSMLAVIGVHYLSCCKTAEHIIPENQTYELLNLTELLLSYGVNMFVIITGYFMVGNRESNFRKVFDLLWEVCFYGIILYCISLIYGIQHFSTGILFKSMFPLLFGLRWFVKAYVILYLLSPFINVGLDYISKEKHMILIIILGCFFSLWPFLMPSPPLDDYGFSYNHFIVLYIIANYLKKYVHQYSLKKCFLYLIASSAVSYLLMLSTFDFPIFSTMKAMSLAHNSPFNVISCFSLFMIFAHFSWYNKWINLFAASAFAVYIIHGDFNTMGYLFSNVLKGTDYQTDWIWFFHLLISIIIIYIGCFVFDFIMKQTILKIFHMLFDKVKILNLRIDLN